MKRSLRAGSVDIPPYHAVELRGDLGVPLEAGAAECGLLPLQGRPIGEAVAQCGPFVMNTREGIEQAFCDYRKTRFGGWPWSHAEPVHLRAKGRFARHADGREEKPAG